jgi:hypothetical protein
MVALVGSLSPWYRPAYHGSVSGVSPLVINGLDVTDGKVTLILGLVAFMSGLLILRARRSEPKVAAWVALAAGLATSTLGVIDAVRAKGQFVARATRGLTPEARAAELAVAKRLFDSGGLSIQVRPGVVLVLIGGLVVLVGGLVALLTAGRSQTA